MTRLLFAAAATLYLLTMQRMICGDGIFFDEMLQRGSLLNVHLLLLPLAWSVRTVLSVFVDVSPETAMKIVSALAGGAGVAMTWRVARQVLGSTAQALAAAVTLAGLTGYWFHSTATELHALHPACASLLLLGLVRALRAGQRGDTSLDRPTLWCCTAGALLTPLSHLSGAAMALPILYSLYRLPARLRRQLLLTVAAGSLAFGALFTAAYWNSPRVRNLFAGSAAAGGLSAAGTAAMLKQLLLYSLPVSTLVPAGLAALFRQAPGLAWLCLAWIVAWPIVVVQYLDFLLGSYHTPTFPVQAILAVAAFSQLARTPLRAVLVMVLAALPMAGVLARDTKGLAPDNEQATTVLCPWMDDLVLGLWLWLLAAMVLLILLLLTRRTPALDIRSRWLPILPITAFLLSGPYLLPKLRADPYRDRIREMNRLADEGDLVFYLPESFAERNHWRRFFSTDGKERAFSPADVHYREEEDLDVYRAAAIQAWISGRGVWFVGDMDRYPALLRPRDKAPHEGVLRLFDFLQEAARFVRPPGTSEPIYRLLPKQ